MVCPVKYMHWFLICLIFAENPAYIDNYELATLADTQDPGHVVSVSSTDD